MYRMIPSADNMPVTDAGIKHVVLIASGKGGVGKSTVASNLAVCLAGRGYAVGLLDADVNGPSLPTLFALRHRPRVQNRRLQPVERFGIRLLSLGMLADESKVFAWRGPTLKGALMQLLRDAEWGDLDILLVDMPPGTGEVQIAILQLVSVSGSIVVTTPQDVALASVRRSLSMFTQVGVSVLALVENMAYYCCPQCNTMSRIFPGEGSARLAAEFDIRLVVQLPLISEVASSSDEGIPFLCRSSVDTAYAGGFDTVSDAVMSSIAAEGGAELAAPRA